MHTAMGTRTYTILALGAIFLATLFLGGCGNATVAGALPPTVTGANPPAGLSAGGEFLQVTGSSFIPGATVLVGGNPATNVTVVDGNTITCTTPAGLPGTHCAVQVNTVGGLGVMLGAYLYIPPPKINQVSPNESSTFGGMQHTLVGSGFLDNAAGPNTVTVDGNPATGVITISDTIILYTAPAEAAGLKDVVVTNANGTDDSLLNYFRPIMAAQANGNAASWGLYAINPSTGAAHLVGSLPTGMTAMDFAPDGTLYGTTAEPKPEPRDLVTIDPATAAVTVLGQLNDPTGGNHILQGIGFVGSTLYGTEVVNDADDYGDLWEIDPLSGALTLVGPGAIPDEFGGGIAVDATDTNVYWLGEYDTALYLMDVSGPTVTAGPPITGVDSMWSYNLGGMTFHQGTLYVTTVGPTDYFYRIDTATGVATRIGSTLPQTIRSLASPSR